MHATWRSVSCAATASQIWPTAPWSLSTPLDKIQSGLEGGEEPYCAECRLCKRTDVGNQRYFVEAKQGLVVVSVVGGGGGPRDEAEADNGIAKGVGVRSKENASHLASGQDGDLHKLGRAVWLVRWPWLALLTSVWWGSQWAPLCARTTHSSCRGDAAMRLSSAIASRHGRRSRPSPARSWPGHPLCSGTLRCPGVSAVKGSLLSDCQIAVVARTSAPPLSCFLLRRRSIWI